MSDPPRLRDLSTPGGDFSRSLLRDAAPTRPITAADALRLKAVVAKAGAAHASGWFAVSVVPKALAAVTVVVFAGGAVVAARHRAPAVAQSSVRRAIPSPSPRAEPPPKPVAEALSSESAAAAPAAVAPLVPPVVVEAPAAARAHVPAARPRVIAEPVAAPVEPESAPSLADELRVVDEARGALRDEPARALAALDDAARRFSRGQLADEREALRVEALARLGRWDEARVRAAALEARAPQSPQCARVRALLREHPAP